MRFLRSLFGASCPPLHPQGGEGWVRGGHGSGLSERRLLGFAAETPERQVQKLEKKVADLQQQNVDLSAQVNSLKQTVDQQKRCTGAAGATASRCLDTRATVRCGNCNKPEPQFQPTSMRYKAAAEDHCCETAGTAARSSARKFNCPSPGSKTAPKEGAIRTRYDSKVGMYKETFSGGQWNRGDVVYSRSDMDQLKAENLAKRNRLGNYFTDTHGGTLTPSERNAFRTSTVYSTRQTARLRCAQLMGWHPDELNFRVSGNNGTTESYRFDSASNRPRMMPGKPDYIDSTDARFGPGEEMELKQRERWLGERYDRQPPISAEHLIREWQAGKRPFPTKVGYRPESERAQYSRWTERSLSPESRRRSNERLLQNFGRNSQKVIEELGPSGKLRTELKNGDIRSWGINAQAWKPVIEWIVKKYDKEIGGKGPDHELTDKDLSQMQDMFERVTNARERMGRHEAPPSQKPIPGQLPTRDVSGTPQPQALSAPPAPSVAPRSAPSAAVDPFAVPPEKSIYQAKIESQAPNIILEKQGPRDGIHFDEWKVSVRGDPFVPDRWIDNGGGKGTPWRLWPSTTGLEGDKKYPDLDALIADLKKLEQGTDVFAEAPSVTPDLPSPAPEAASAVPQGPDWSKAKAIEDQITDPKEKKRFKDGMEYLKSGLPAGIGPKDVTLKIDQPINSEGKLVQFPVELYWKPEAGTEIHIFFSVDNNNWYAVYNSPKQGSKIAGEQESYYTSTLDFVPQELRQKYPQVVPILSAFNQINKGILNPSAQPAAPSNSADVPAAPAAPSPLTRSAESQAPALTPQQRQASNARAIQTVKGMGMDIDTQGKPGEEVKASAEIPALDYLAQIIDLWRTDTEGKKQLDQIKEAVSGGKIIISTADDVATKLQNGDTLVIAHKDTKENIAKKLKEWPQHAEQFKNANNTIDTHDYTNKNRTDVRLHPALTSEDLQHLIGDGNFKSFRKELGELESKRKDLLQRVSIFIVPQSQKDLQGFRNDVHPFVGVSMEEGWQDRLTQALDEAEKAQAKLSPITEAETKALESGGTVERLNQRMRKVGDKVVYQRTDVRTEHSDVWKGGDGQEYMILRGSKGKPFLAKATPARGDGDLFFVEGEDEKKMLLSRDGYEYTFEERNGRYERGSSFFVRGAMDEQETLHSANRSESVAGWGNSGAVSISSGLFGSLSASFDRSGALVGESMSSKWEPKQADVTKLKEIRKELQPFFDALDQGRKSQEEGKPKEAHEHYLRARQILVDVGTKVQLPLNEQCMALTKELCSTGLRSGDKGHFDTAIAEMKKLFANKPALAFEIPDQSFSQNSERNSESHVSPDEVCDWVSNLLRNPNVQKEDLEAAETILSEILKSRRNDNDACAVLAAVCARLGKWDDAVKNQKIALENPMNDVKDRYEQCLKAYEEKKAPDDVPFRSAAERQAAYEAEQKEAAARPPSPPESENPQDEKPEAKMEGEKQASAPSDVASRMSDALKGVEDPTETIKNYATATFKDRGYEVAAILATGTAGRLQTLNLSKGEMRLSISFNEDVNRIDKVTRNDKELDVSGIDRSKPLTDQIEQVLKKADEKEAPPAPLDIPKLEALLLRQLQLDFASPGIMEIIGQVVLEKVVIADEGKTVQLLGTAPDDQIKQACQKRALEVIVSMKIENSLPKELEVKAVDVSGIKVAPAAAPAGSVAPDSAPSPAAPANTPEVNSDHAAYVAALQKTFVGRNPIIGDKDPFDDGADLPMIIDANEDGKFTIDLRKNDNTTRIYYRSAKNHEGSFVEGNEYKTRTPEQVKAVIDAYDRSAEKKAVDENNAQLEKVRIDIEQFLNGAAAKIPGSTVSNQELSVPGTYKEKEGLLKFVPLSSAGVQSGSAQVRVAFEPATNDPFAIRESVDIQGWQLMTVQQIVDFAEKFKNGQVVDAPAEQLDPFGTPPASTSAPAESVPAGADPFATPPAAPETANGNKVPQEAYDKLRKENGGVLENYSPEKRQGMLMTSFSTGLKDAKGELFPPLETKLFVTLSPDMPLRIVKVEIGAPDKKMTVRNEKNVIEEKDISGDIIEEDLMKFVQERSDDPLDQTLKALPQKAVELVKEAAASATAIPSSEPEPGKDGSLLDRVSAELDSVERLSDGMSAALRSADFAQAAKQLLADHAQSSSETKQKVFTMMNGLALSDSPDAKQDFTAKNEGENVVLSKGARTITLFPDGKITVKEGEKEVAPASAVGMDDIKDSVNKF